MRLFEWKEEDYGISCPEIDRQHERWFHLAQEMHRALVTGKAREILGQTLSGFITYTRAHFAAEERLMLTHHYPDLVSHKTQHDDLCDQLSRLQSEFEAGQPTITMDVLQFLKAWLVHHISATDQKMGAYLRQESPNQADLTNRER